MFSSEDVNISASAETKTLPGKHVAANEGEAYLSEYLAQSIRKKFDVLVSFLRGN